MTASPNHSSLLAVLFDWDFTLAYSLGLDVSHIERTAVLFQNYGVHCTKDEVMAVHSALEKDLARGKFSGSLRPQKKREIIRLYQELLRRLGHPDTSYAFAYQIYAGYGLLPHTLFADVLPTLNTLQNRQVTLGILSNHSTSVRPTIEQLLGHLIPPENITISEEVGVHKPGKTIFKRAAARLGQRPSNCLYVGDNLQVDAIAAVQQGGYAGGVWIDRSGQDKPDALPSGVYRITNLAQLILLL